MTSSTVPHMREAIPFISNALAFRRDPVRLLQQGTRRHGEIFSFSLLGKTVYALIGPRANEFFFRASEDELSHRDIFRFLVPFFGPGVVYDIPAARFEEHMHFLHPSLRDHKLKAYANIIAAQTDKMLDAWGDGGEVDLLAEMTKLVFHNSGHCFLGDAFQWLCEEHDFIGLYRALEGGLNFAAFINPYLPLPAMRRRDAARARITQLISGVMARRRAGGVDSDDFLGTLMQAHYQDGSAVSEDVVIGLIITILFAGYRTTASLSTWLGLLLMENPQHLARLQGELDELPRSREAPTVTAIRSLRHLDNCVRESERLYPPVSTTMRMVEKDMTFAGHRIPAGALAMVSPSVSHRLPSLFSNPDQFDPDRFGPERNEARGQAFAIIGFGGGARHCIGRAFASLQIKTIWTRILDRFELEACTTGKHHPSYGELVATPQSPCVVRVRRRVRPSAQAGQGVPADGPGAQSHDAAHRAAREQA